MRKSILVTGGSRGIGAATAVLAGKKGHVVFVNYNQQREKAEAVIKQVNEAGGEGHLLPGDVSDETVVKKMFDAMQEIAGGIDALVNNAGILDLSARLEEMTLERWQRIFNVNVFGAFLCAKEAVQHMSIRHGGKGGVIVNISSVAAVIGAPFEYIDYAASKGALDTMTIGLAKEVAAEGIRVNGVRPGLIYTDIHGDSGDPERVDKLKHNIPMKRGGKPEEVAALILWLISNDASYVTGDIISVSGGR